MAMIEGNEYTKISIQKDLHNLIKLICQKEGTKMYFFEDNAVKEYIRVNYPKYINEGNTNLFNE